ncbi:MAG: hypothetical protein HQM10_25495 [Candidatus Riflebacteria bacterium]|nr:hypothetical protein [Candidatus Riflebacteria bacterium]
MDKKLFFENVYIASEARKYPLTERIISRIDFGRIVDITGENHPGDGLLLTVNKGTFLKPCPGMKGNICCGLWVIEWGMGCPFNCEYCVLQYYQKSGDITLYMNWNDCIAEIKELGEKNMPARICTGEYGDSVALEPVFPFHSEIIPEIAHFKNISIEIKTKSSDIENLLSLNHYLNDNSARIIFSFSVNALSNIRQFERGTSTLIERIFAARKAVTKGFKTAFHFDPIIPLNNWPEEYAETVDLIAKHISHESIAWISLGTFRFPHGFIANAEEKYPDSMIFREEFYPCKDGKMRYFRPFREEIYRYMTNYINQKLPETKVYLCMESQDVWERINNTSLSSSTLKTSLDKLIQPNLK